MVAHSPAASGKCLPFAAHGQRRVASHGGFCGRRPHRRSHLMAGGGDIPTILRSLSLHAFDSTVVRCVALLPLTARGTPDYLFASGKANRFNPSGIACVYFSEDEKTARA